MKSYVLVQAVRRVKPKGRNRYIHSILGDRWLVIAAEVDQESASEVLSDLEVHCE